MRYDDLSQQLRSEAARLLGRIGGKAGTGPAKARHITSEQARSAINIRWARVRAEKRKRH